MFNQREKKRERERERKREREKERDRQREKERKRERERERERDRHRNRERNREINRKTEKQKEKQTERGTKQQTDREVDRHNKGFLGPIVLKRVNQVHETALPEPTAIPMSAALRAGASLTPSPVIATTLPFDCNARTMYSLCLWKKKQEKK